MVHHNMRQAYLLEVNLTQISVDHETLFIDVHVGIRVHFCIHDKSLWA